MKKNELVLKMNLPVEDPLLKGKRKMVAFRFPQKLLQKFNQQAKELGLEKTKALEISMLAIIKSQEGKK